MAVVLFGLSCGEWSSGSGPPLEGDDDDEIAVKHDNAFAESFDILTWDGYARYGEGIYNATCSPAWF